MFPVMIQKTDLKISQCLVVPFPGNGRILDHSIYPKDSHNDKCHVIRLVKRLHRTVVSFRALHFLFLYYKYVLK